MQLILCDVMTFHPCGFLASCLKLQTPGNSQLILAFLFVNICMNLCTIWVNLLRPNLLRPHAGKVSGIYMHRWTMAMGILGMIPKIGYAVLRGSSDPAGLKDSELGSHNEQKPSQL